MSIQERKINKNTPIPLYFQLKEIIISEIKSGAYKPGSNIPTEDELSSIFNISRTTIRQAVAELVQEGWLYRIKSKGTFVSAPKISQNFIQEISSFNEQIQKTGRVPNTEILDLKKADATAEVAAALEVSVGSPVVYLHRKRLADREPIVTVKTYLPYEKCAKLLDMDLTDKSLYEELERIGIKVYKLKWQIEAVEAVAGDVNLLQIKKGKPIQLFHSIGYSDNDVPVEYSIARYIGDRNKFEVVISRDI